MKQEYKMKIGEYKENRRIQGRQKYKKKTG